MPALSNLQGVADKPSDPVVTWHVIVWVLLTLAINSMSQPSGHFCCLNYPKKYRIYMCLSPVLCLADAISILGSMLITKITLGTSVVASARYTWFWRSRIDLAVNLDEDQPVELWNLPRSIVFVVGTLPAFVKLTSFSGLPWSKAWGFIFVSSFVIIEALSVMAMRGPDGSPCSEAAALRLSELRWNADVNRPMREKVENVNTGMLFLNLILALVAVGCQVALLLWPVGDLLRYGIDDDFGASVDVITVNKYIETIISAIAGTYLGIACLITVANWHYALFPRVSWSRVWVNVWVMFSIPFMFMLHPLVRENEAESSSSASSMRSFWLAVFTFSGGICWVTYKILSMLCLRAPKMARALLVAPPTYTGTRTDGHEQATDNEDDAKHDRVDSFGLCCVVGFCAQLSAGLMWYAYRYDPAGTLNPPWTDVFG